MDPINYLGMVPQVDLSRQFLGGLQVGASIGEIQQQAEARQLALQQKQLAAKRAQQYQSDVAAAMSTPTPQAFSALALKYPEQREAVKQAWDQQDSATRKSQGEAALQVSFALESGNKDAAKKLLQERITALDNSKADSSHEKLILGAIDTHPNEVRSQLLQWAAFTQDPEKFAENYGRLNQEQRAQELQGAAVREAGAKADGEVADAAQKNLGIVAQKAGALAKPGVKPSQAQTMFRVLAAQGVIPKDELQGYLDGIPADPKALPEYLHQVQAAGLSANEQRKYTDVDANTAANNATSRANTAANNATQIKTTGMNNATTLAVQDRIDARTEARTEVEPTLSPPTLRSMAEQYLAGDPAAIQNLGRGAQGAANLVAVRNEIAKLADERGMDGAAIAAKLADYGGLKAGLRTSAQISARVENAISEAKELAPLAIAASKDVSRSGLLPFGKAQVMFNTQTNDPALKKFVTANNGLVAAYAGAMARGQKPTVSDYEHARHILAEAQSQEAYEATVNQMYLEMEAASRAPQNVREHLRNEIGGGKGHGPAPAANGQVIDFGSLR